MFEIKYYFQSILINLLSKSNNVNLKIFYYKYVEAIITYFMETTDNRIGF